ncbi:unnamed protein product [Protopolystoma xenopodis]|uniref:Uncharacterized protein n=1 Tax=Protopolystoma xenopodis TaxID=117903 RepID=A0A3S5BRN1_9PLAT|nr:unnamed protein product [Protopolystoma xenopodis]
MTQKPLGYTATSTVESEGISEYQGRSGLFRISYSLMGVPMEQPHICYSN